MRRAHDALVLDLSLQQGRFSDERQAEVRALVGHGVEEAVHLGQQHPACWRLDDLLPAGLPQLLLRGHLGPGSSLHGTRVTRSGRDRQCAALFIVPGRTCTRTEVRPPRGAIAQGVKPVAGRRATDIVVMNYTQISINRIQ